MSTSALVVSARAASAADATGLLQTPGRPEPARTVKPRRTATPPQIDGRLTDEVWKTATKITEFIQMTPVEGAPATEATDVYITYDAERIYFGFYAHYSDVGLIRANRVERDEIARDDTITVYFDTTLDRQRAYAFSVNGYGVQGDAVVVGGVQRSDAGPGLPEGNVTWDALFSSAGGLVEDGWTAELAIPFKSLRYPARGSNETHRWGFQIARLITSKDESVVAFPVTRRIAGFVSQMGVLDGLTGLSTSRNLEVLPTFTAIGARTLDVGAGRYARESTAEGAVNLKYGVTSNLTADFTVNPDFSQIESDRPQIEVNQRFPLLYPELRPFFLEGQEIFQVSAPINLLNTRTIADPGYGAKLTGKVGKLAMGLLAANDEAAGKRVALGDAAYGETAQVVVSRIRYDAYAESYIGTLFTDREFMDSYSRVAGLDGQFRLSRTDRWFFIAFQSSHRDSSGREDSGPAFGTLYRHSGRNVTASAFTGFTNPGFRSDVGVVRRVDSRRSYLDLGYRWWPQGRVINWGPQVHYERNYNYARVLEDEIIGPEIQATFARNVRLGFGAERSLERYRDVNFWKWRYSTTFNIASSRRFTVSGDVNWGDQIRFIANPFLGRSTGATIAANVRPFSRLQSQIDVNVSRLVDPRTSSEVFDVRIVRSLTTFQFSERLLLRNILERNTFDRTLAVNVLLTYRVNSGTVFFAGYDDHYKQGDRIDSQLFPTASLRQTNRALFTKISYLFRYR